MPSEKFPKQHRLKSGDVQRVFQNGKRVRGHFFSLLFIHESITNARQVAFIVGRKLVREAVRRNRYKRWMREAYRRDFPKEHLQGRFVFLLNKEPPNPSASWVASEMKALINRFSPK